MRGAFWRLAPQFVYADGREAFRWPATNQASRCLGWTLWESIGEAGKGMVLLWP